MRATFDKRIIVLRAEEQRVPRARGAEPQTMQNRLDILMHGGLVTRGVATVISGRESFVYTVCADDMTIEKHLMAVRMEHAREVSAQRQKTYLGRLQKRTRCPDATARALATVALKAALRKAPSTAKRDPLVAALFGEACA